MPPAAIALLASSSRKTSEKAPPSLLVKKADAGRSRQSLSLGLYKLSGRPISLSTVTALSHRTRIDGVAGVATFVRPSDTGCS
jgi:hypothetical protein